MERKETRLGANTREASDGGNSMRKHVNTWLRKHVAVRLLWAGGSAPARLG